MSVRNVVLGLVLAAAAAVAPTASYAHVDFIVDVAPPVAPVEIVPAARVGYVWSPGYWRWDGRHHVWIAGSWIRARSGWHWVPHHWVANGPQWHYIPGYWERVR